jgi:hypothetical protein
MYFVVSVHCVQVVGVVTQVWHIELQGTQILLDRNFPFTHDRHFVLESTQVTHEESQTAQYF